MRKSLLSALLALLTLSVSITTEAAILKTTSYSEMTGHDSQHHKKHHKKDKHHHRHHHHRHRPKGVLIHHGHTQYIFSDGRYYCERGGVYKAVRPAIGVMISTLPRGYVTVKNKRGRIRYSYRGVLYKKSPYKGRMMFKVVGFM